MRVEMEIPWKKRCVLWNSDVFVYLRIKWWREKCEQQKTWRRTVSTRWVTEERQTWREFCSFCLRIFRVLEFESCRFFRILSLLTSPSHVADVLFELLMQGFPWIPSKVSESAVLPVKVQLWWWHEMRIFSSRKEWEEPKERRETYSQTYPSRHDLRLYFHNYFLYDLIILSFTSWCQEKWKSSERKGERDTVVIEPTHTKSLQTNTDTKNEETEVMRMQRLRTLLMSLQHHKKILNNTCIHKSSSNEPSCVDGWTVSQEAPFAFIHLTIIISNTLMMVTLMVLSLQQMFTSMRSIVSKKKCFGICFVFLILSLWVIVTLLRDSHNNFLNSMSSD
jgi:hypothetical protein